MSLGAHKSILVLFVVGIVLAFGACSSDEAGDLPVQATGNEQTAVGGVSIRSFTFTPHVLEVSAGSEVTWTNGDEILHTVTFGVPMDPGVPGVSKGRPAKPDGLFDEELDGAGTTASFRFEQIGEFTYYCEIHAGMTGEISVT